MHHYIFEPSEHTDDHWLKLDHRLVAFRNLAFADFDVLLCGHKHVPNFNTQSYGDHFDERAVYRYVMNCYRRQLGLHALPCQFFDSKGKPLSRSISDAIKLIIRFLKSPLGRKETKNKPYLERLFEILNEGLDSAEKFEEKLKFYLSSDSFGVAPVLSSDELKEIRLRLSTQFSQPQREKLKPVCQGLFQEARQLKARPFLQVLCGSACKSAQESKYRTFNIYEVGFSGRQWTFKSFRYSWDWSQKAFIGPLEQTQSFQRR